MTELQNRKRNSLQKKHKTSTHKKFQIYAILVFIPHISKKEKVGTSSVTKHD